MVPSGHELGGGGIFAFASYSPIRTRASASRSAGDLHRHGRWAMRQPLSHFDARSHLGHRTNVNGLSSRPTGERNRSPDRPTSGLLLALGTLDDSSSPGIGISSRDRAFFGEVVAPNGVGWQCRRESRHRSVREVVSSY